MFCSNCGQAGHGKFCSDCGTALATTADARPFAPAELVPDWDHEVRYDVILHFPGVREQIEQHASRAKKRLSGERFLAMADQLIPLGVPLESLATAAQALYTKLGIKTGKQREQLVASPVSRVLVGVLCSLAERGLMLSHVRQAANGVLLEAELPSDVFSLQGHLVIRIEQRGEGTHIHAAAQIDGQLFDWGKSRRCLDQLFADLSRALNVPSRQGNESSNPSQCVA